jgi:hypothetical protein
MGWGFLFVKKLMFLTNFEFIYSIKKVLLLCSVMAAVQNLSFLIFCLRKDYEALRFENILDISKYSIIFYLAFIALMGLQFYFFQKDYIGAKGINTLFTLPAKRSHIFFSKYLSAILGVLILISFQIVNVFITYGLYLVYYKDVPKVENGLYMAFVRDSFLGLFFTDNIYVLIYIIVIIASIISATLFLITVLKSKRWIYFLFLLILFITINKFISNHRWLDTIHSIGDNDIYYETGFWFLATIVANLYIIKTSIKLIVRNEIL